MKSAVETLSPTRVRLTVEVPFEELKPSVDAAYKKIARQVRVQGFRPGKVPPRVLDTRVGRGTVLAEAVEEAIPRWYGEAVRENEVAVLGQPLVDVTEFADGAQLVFTAEVDVRPEVELPPYDGIEVTVDDAEITEAETEEQISAMRDRFAVLTGVERPARTGDYVTLDISATVDGEPVPGAQTSGLSYEVGSGTLMPGLDEALVGLTAGQDTTFDSDLVAGELAGRTARVSVTVGSVKEKQLPDLDDDFAQTASEFDTLAELEADVRDRLSRVKRLQQGLQARERTLEALLAATQVPLPEAVVEAEVEFRKQSARGQLDQAGVSLQDYLTHEGRSSEEFDAELAAEAARSVKAQLVLDALADREQVGVGDAELTELVVQRAQRVGATPNEYAQQLVQTGQLPALMAEVRRGKALAQVLRNARINDAAGRPVDLSALDADLRPQEEAGPPEVGGDATTAAATTAAATSAPAAKPAVQPASATSTTLPAAATWGPPQS